MDHSEGRSLLGWDRHLTLVMLALAFLVSSACAARRLALSPLPLGPQPPSALAPLDLCPLSVPEARHLLARLRFPAPSSVVLVFAWSAWRRCHQRRASFFQTRRRVKAG